MALLIALIFLAMFSCMAASVTAFSDGSLVAARNETDSRQASALAMTGVELMKQALGGLAVPGTHYAGDMHQAMATQLTTLFANSTMVNSAFITQSLFGGVMVPSFTLTWPDGRTGIIALNVKASGGALDNTTVTIQSIGLFGNASRTVTYNLTVQRGQSILANFGIASKSAISMTGNASVAGANNAAEANLLSATYSTTNAIQLTGNINLAGDAIVCNPLGKVKTTGNIHIGGNQIIGAPEPQWPTVDITPFTPYATNVQSSGSSGNITLTNIRIPPGTNPTFSGNTTINGVVYIQSPNKVSFTGNVTLTGVIVCDTPTVPDLTKNYVKFTGNVQTYGVESLPAGGQFDGLRSLTGSFLLAPGFAASFTGNSTIVNGCLVASQFSFTGNSGGRIKGGVICLADSQFTMTGNSPLVIDKNGANLSPAGLSSSYKLICVSGSYTE
jgi:hypothetical protein